MKKINLDENDKAGDQENMISNNTFINPSQFEQTTSGIFFKCEICDFVSASINFIKEHKATTHNWCTLCFSSFKNQERLKKQIKDLHSIIT
jgi:hypothetical protein